MPFREGKQFWRLLGRDAKKSFLEDACIDTEKMPPEQTLPLGSGLTLIHFPGHWVRKILEFLLT